MSSFIKQPSEIYPIAMEFSGLLPEGASLASGVVSALDTLTGLDATATVLHSSAAVIDGTQVQAVVQAGTNGTPYKLTFRVSLTPGSPTSVLEEDLLMFVQDL